MKFIWGLLSGIFIATVFFLWYIKKQISPSLAEATASTEVVESPMADNGFRDFYLRFHEDSLYQLEHVLFPLEGVPPRAEDGSLPENFKWQKEGWVMHKLFDDASGEFSQQINEMSEGLVIDQIKDANGIYAMQRRFAKMGDTWYLIYYAAMNMMIADGGDMAADSLAEME